jgi:hypothetical protein
MRDDCNDAMQDQTFQYVPLLMWLSVTFLLVSSEFIVNVVDENRLLEQAIKARCMKPLSCDMHISSMLEVDYWIGR